MSISFATYSDFEAFLEAQQHRGYRMCQPRGTRYVQNGTVAIRDHICAVEGISRARSTKKRRIYKLGTGSCSASFEARYSVDADKKPHGFVVLTKVNLEHTHDPVVRGQTVPRRTQVRPIDEQPPRGGEISPVAGSCPSRLPPPNNWFSSLPLERRLELFKHPAIIAHLDNDPHFAKLITQALDHIQRTEGATTELVDNQ